MRRSDLPERVTVEMSPFPRFLWGVHDARTGKLVRHFRNSLDLQHWMARYYAGWQLPITETPDNA